MAAFVDFVRARLMPGAFGRTEAATLAMHVPSAVEPFGRPSSLRLHWQVDRAGGLASCWEQAAGRARPIPPS